VRYCGTVSPARLLVYAGGWVPGSRLPGKGEGRPGTDGRVSFETFSQEYSVGYTSEGRPGEDLVLHYTTDHAVCHSVGDCLRLGTSTELCSHSGVYNTIAVCSNEPRHAVVVLYLLGATTLKSQLVQALFM
jgi:hypothetical protein